MSDIHDKVQQQFGNHARNYVTSQVHASGYSLDRLLEVADVQPDTRAIDIATGGGHVALGLARRGAQVLVTDLTPRMLAAAGEHIRSQLPDAQTVRYAQVDGVAMPFVAGHFDLLTCRIAPHHFTDVPRFVKEAARVVRTGGKVAIVDQIAPPERKAAEYLNAFEKFRDPSHVWEYPQADWEWFFEDAGLRITHREICRNRLEFGWWTRMQNMAADDVTRLRAMLNQAPQAAAEWLQPELADVGAAYFSLWQLILVGVKD